MYNFEQTIASFRLEILEEELDLLENHLAVIEGFLEPEVKKRQETIAGIVDALNNNIRERINAGAQIGFRSSSDVTAEEILATTEWRKVNHLAQTLRKSFFLSLYAFLEARFDEECRYEGRRQKERDDVLITLNDIAGTGIIRARTYWTKVLRRNFPDNTQWQAIHDGYRPLRNCIVHSSGRFDKTRTDKAAQALQKFIDSKRSLSVLADEIILNQDFNKEALNNVRGFFIDLLRV
jgi:hypothetical protein